ncbi:MAG: hypothetical protein QOG67_696 [Verrucomicrobiota bacterium]
MDVENSLELGCWALVFRQVALHERGRWCCANNVKQLISYLKDHLAGSVSAVELLDHLIKTHERDPLAKFFEALRDDIIADQDALKRLIHRFNSKESSVRKAGAWIVEKFTRLKMKAGGEKVGELGLVQALEVLLLGITGKQLLWRALSASLGESPLLKGVDLSQLEERAINQIDRVEAKRLDAAREAFLR